MGQCSSRDNDTAGSTNPSIILRQAAKKDFKKNQNCINDPDFILLTFEGKLAELRETI